MENQDPELRRTPCDDEEGERYLGDRDQIESLLGFGNMSEVRERHAHQISLQPQQQINSVLEGTK